MRHLSNQDVASLQTIFSAHAPLVWSVIVAIVVLAAGVQAFRYLTKNKTNKALELAAKAGDAESQFECGMMYASRKNGKAALSWLKKAADQDHTLSQYQLGELYFYGELVDEDLNLAYAWYEKAALRGNMQAQYQLVELLSYEDFPDPENKLSFSWCEKSANQGYAPAQVELADRFLDGEEGAEKNIDKALFWYKKAAAQGDEDALSAIEEIEGVSSDAH